MKKITLTYSKLILDILAFLFTSLLISHNVFSLTKKQDILILASYSSENLWENDVINGFIDNSSDFTTSKIEFLDFKSSSSPDYNDTLHKLLNLKYKDSNFDYIITLDDEAFIFARENLFNEDSFLYKKKIILAGVNSLLTLSNEESEYIGGIYEYHDYLSTINVILNSNKNIENIYLLLDSSIYCKTIEQKFVSLNNFAVRPYRVASISASNFDDILSRIPSIDPEKSAIYLCGTYSNYGFDSSEEVSPSDIVNAIKSLTNAPIYTILYCYTEAGCIGGVLNEGYTTGSTLASALTNFINTDFINIVIPSNNTFNVPIFNFAALRYYNINPRLLPSNSIIINRKFYQLMFSKPVEIFIWICLLLIILATIYLLINSFKNRQKMNHSKKLLNEAIAREELRIDFILTISHELRTPLNIIINASKLIAINIKNCPSDNAKYITKQLNYIQRNCNRLLKQINNLIDSCKLELNHMNASFSNCNIVDVVEDIVQSVVYLASSKNIEIIFDTNTEELFMAVDVDMIERIIINLLSNSIKFIGNGNLIKVILTHYEGSNSVNIIVADNGLGMTKELQEGLFDRFKKEYYNMSLTRSHEGSGLGLYIVKNLILLHNGSIIVDSELGKGSAFTITLPTNLPVSKKINENGLDSSLSSMIEVEFSDI